MKRHERIAGLFLLLVGVAVAIDSYFSLGFGSFLVPGAGFLPFWYGVALAVLSAIWVLGNRGPEENPIPFWEKGHWVRPVIAFIAMVVYGWLMDKLGYVLSTFLFVIAWQQLIEREKWGKTLLISVLGTAAMYLLFGHFLRVPLPQGILPL